MDARSWSRHAIKKDVVCTIEGRRDVVFLYDLSTAGCMMEVPHDDVAVGDLVRVELLDFETAQGEVVWRAERNAGVRFNSPVHEAIVRHMGFTPVVSTFDEQLPRDRFGRALPALGAIERREFRR